MPYNNRGEAVSGIPIRQWQDMPDPVLKDGVLTIIPDDAAYVWVNDIFSPYPLAHPGTGKRATFKAVNGHGWHYMGPNACFRDYDSRGDIEVRGQVLFTAINGVHWDCKTAGGSASFQSTNLGRFRDSLGLGSVVGPNYGFSIQLGSITGFGTGLSAQHMSFFEINTIFVASAGTQTTTFFRVHGNQTTGAVNFILVSTSTTADETLLDLDDDMKATANSVLLDNIQKDGPFLGAVFASESMTQATPIVDAQGSAGLFPNSTVKGKLNIINNALITTISTADTPTPINTLWSDGEIEERISFRDTLTFDGTTDVCSTLFNHGMVDDAVITLKEGGGLPNSLFEKDYFLINTTAATFQLSNTLGGPAVDFSSTGTPTNYYDHETGISASGWMIYTGLSQTDVHVDGWLTASKSGNAQLGVARIMHIDADFPFASHERARGSVVTVSNISDASSQLSDIITLQPGEGIRIDWEAVANTDAVTITNALVSIRKT